MESGPSVEPFHSVSINRMKSPSDAVDQESRLVPVTAYLDCRQFT